MNMKQKIDDEILPQLTQETCKLLNLKKKRTFRIELAVR